MFCVWGVVRVMFEVVVICLGICGLGGLLDGVLWFGMGLKYGVFYIGFG